LFGFDLSYKKSQESG